MTEAPHVPAAFINVIREEGTKQEACDWLQKVWNEKCALKKQIADLPAAVKGAFEFITGGDHQEILAVLKRSQCKTCGGTGEMDDAAPGDVMFGRWVCADCDGKGWDRQAVREVVYAAQPLLTQPDPVKDAAHSPIYDLIPLAIQEAQKGMRKFPQPNYVISKWAEETGEVTKALIHNAEGRESLEAVKGEIVQALAMLHRLFVEGDRVHGLRALAEQEQR